MSIRRIFLLALLIYPAAVFGAVRVQSAPVPQEMRSSAFSVRVNGQAVEVAHAAANYDFVSFDATGAVDVEITADEPGFWDHGVDIQPWRLNMRPTRTGKTIRFRLRGPAKLSIGRPGDFLNRAKMLFLFAGTPPPPPPSGPNVEIVPAGIHRGSLNPKSGDTIYLAPGSYILGSLNLWKVEGVKVMGRGTIVYEGAVNPNADDSWLQEPDRHCIGAFNAHHVEIDGVTCIVRARSWSIQMKDSSGLVYDDLRLIGGNSVNANQDGMDWLGGGDTVVRNSFLRASDDDLAMEGNWDGYTLADMLRPGNDVQNILVENSVLSTSISNIVRAGWPQKIYNSRNFTLRDSDILHGGIGACGQTFGLLGFWGANGATGDHSNFTFENLFLDNWYSLVQMEQEQPVLHGFTFRNIWALDQPPLAVSTITGQVTGVVFDNVKYGQTPAAGNADLPLVMAGGAQPAQFVAQHDPQAAFTVDPPQVAAGQKVKLTAHAARKAHYTWLFGDGTQATGRRVHHRFPDSEGTQLDGRDGAGRFRVLLQVKDRSGKQDWASQGVVAVSEWHSVTAQNGPMSPGLALSVYPGEWQELPELSQENAALRGETTGLHVIPQNAAHFVAVWDGFIDIPADGGYTFHLMDRDGARLRIDGVDVARTGTPFAQVCGSPGNAMRYDRGSLGLRAGRHRFHLEGLYAASAEAPRLLWEGPSLPLADVSSGSYSHSAISSVGPSTKGGK